MARALAFKRSGTFTNAPAASIALNHEERHLRRRLLTLKKGEDILIDLPSAVAFEHGDALLLEDGRLIEIIAAEESLYEIKADTAEHLSKLAWHIGNRHLPAQIETQRILIRKDHVIRDMLTGLGAQVSDVVAPFSPERGAYHQHGH